MKLKDRIALVTGGGSGIGRAISLLFVAEGARVFVNDVRLDAARATVAAMGDLAKQAHAIRADVSDSRDVRAMFAGIERRCGNLDVLVNNAGIPSPNAEELNRKYEARMAEIRFGRSIETHWDVTAATSDDEWRRMLAVHLDGTFYCTREALRLMNRRNRGAIINLSSIAALAGMATGSAYAAAKGGVLSFTRAVALEVASRNIRVNAVCPGWVDTSFIQPLPDSIRKPIEAAIPLGRMADPKEIANAVLFLASDESSYITGQWVSPNGGVYAG
jgi:NAD(P)-dependent dehydrogenase (short-subunit alcohol dehydrogenase family)